MQGKVNMAPKMRPRFGLAALAAIGALALATSPTHADIIKASSITALGQGFGAVPRLLTDQINGPGGTEVACDGLVGGSFTTGATTCKATDATIGGNGLVNVDTAANTGDVSPSGTSDKNNLINLSAIGVTNANQIFINYNPSQTGASPTTDILDLTLKFYNSAGTLVTSLDGGCGTSCNLNSTDPLFFGDTGTNLGNGGVGFVLTLDTNQRNLLNAACGVNFVNCATVAGEAQIAFANDGPDSFTLFSSGQVPVPEPASLAIFGSALAFAGLARKLRRRKSV
jgi:hypothetical protein